jgi:hypothetical protein
LPPYWVLIKGVSPNGPASTEKDAKKSTEEETEKPPLVEKDKSTVSTEGKSSAALKYTPDPPPAIRCQVGINGLIAAIPDDFDPEMFDDLSIQHLATHESSPNSTGVWFASAITGLGTTSQTILWNYKIPTAILSFAKKDSIPCGVLVLLDIIDESITPEWATKYEHDAEEEGERRLRLMSEDSRARMREAHMTPEQRRAAFHERAMRQRDVWVAGLNADRRRQAQRAETRMMEAFVSPKWGNGLAAEHCLKWLKKEEKIEEEHDLPRAVGVLLCRMVNEPEFAEELAKMLDGWKAFVENGGLRKGDYSLLKESKVMFGYAVLVAAIIETSVTAALGSLAMDLQECVRIWKRVRLG